MQLTNEDFFALRDIIYDRSGIFFDNKRIFFFNKRIIRRIQSLGFSSAIDYYRYLKFGKDEGEFKDLINLLTTNETYFFRELPHLRSFAEEALPMITEEKKKMGSTTLNVWSAGCSSGDEPYTLAIIIKESFPNIYRWKIKVTGSDIDTDILEKAREGYYSDRAVKDVPDLYLSKYFHKENGGYVISDHIKKMVDFKNVNLISGINMRQFKNIDFVFCRNVLIYFDDKSRKRVLNFFYDSMNKGGFIFLGHAESVGRISAAYRLVRLKNGLVYRK